MAKYTREPINGFTHLFGAILSFAGLLILVIKTTLENPSPVALTAVIIFGISLILLYSASATYHLVIAKENTIKFLRKLDHSMIFILIAGSYAPFCLISAVNPNDGEGLVRLRRRYDRRSHKGYAQEIPRRPFCKPPRNHSRVRFLHCVAVQRILANKNRVPERSPRWAFLHKFFVALFALHNFKRLRKLPAAVLLLFFCHCSSPLSSKLN